LTGHVRRTSDAAKGVTTNMNRIHEKTLRFIEECAVKFAATVDGPFAETKELVAGFSIIQVKSMEEAIEPEAPG